jgi:hypothetical protein
VEEIFGQETADTTMECSFLGGSYSTPWVAAAPNLLETVRYLLECGDNAPIRYLLPPSLHSLSPAEPAGSPNSRSTRCVQANYSFHMAELVQFGVQKSIRSDRHTQRKLLAIANEDDGGGRSARQAKLAQSQEFPLELTLLVPHEERYHQATVSRESKHCDRNTSACR